MLIALSATLLRVGVVAAVHLHHGVSLFDYATQVGDGQSYIAIARAMLGDRSGLSEYDQRVFPGYPAMIAGLHLAGLPFHLAALGIDWLAAGLVAAMAAALFGDRRVGWAMVMLVPQYLINSTLAMSEAPMLTLTLAGLLLARRCRSGQAGAVLGLAGLVRPMACFAVAGAALSSAVEGRCRRGLALALVAGGVFVAGWMGAALWSGHAFENVRIYKNHPGAYAGQLFTYPFGSLISTPLHATVAAWKIPYIWAHVALTLLAIGLLAVKFKRDPRSADGLDALCLPWLAGNTLFVLCIGSHWGFDHYPRFTIPALPALFFALRRGLPDRIWMWGLITVASATAAVATVWPPQKWG